MKRTRLQNARLHQFLGMNNLTGQKDSLALSFSNGRTDRSSELTVEECSGLINFLQNYGHGASGEKLNKMRRKILSICHQLGWYERNGDDILILKNGKPMLDYKHIDEFCQKYGHMHKPLNDYVAHELPELITQFKNVLRSHQQKTP